VEGGRSARRAALTEAAHGLAGGQRLHGHAAFLVLVDRVGIGPQAAVGAGPDDEIPDALWRPIGLQPATRLRTPAPESWMLR
jgi:hypothetical protein